MGPAFALSPESSVACAGTVTRSLVGTPRLDVAGVVVVMFAQWAPHEGCLKATQTKKTPQQERAEGERVEDPEAGHGNVLSA